MTTNSDNDNEILLSLKPSPEKKTVIQKMLLTTNTMTLTKFKL